MRPSAAVPMAAQSAGSSRLLRTTDTYSEAIWSRGWAGPLWSEWDTEFRTLFARRQNTTRAERRHELSGLVRSHRHGLVITTPYRGNKATIKRHKRSP